MQEPLPIETEKKKNKPEPRFKFDKEKHSYLLDGKPLTGVTTVLNVIAKPALIPWAAKMTVEYIRGVLTPVKVGDQELVIFSTQQFHDLLDKAKGAHQVKKETAGDTGTLAHEWIEKFVKGKNPKPNKKIDFITNNFVKWATDNKIQFLESEVRVYSEKYWYAGTCDMVFMMNGKKYIGDVKTQTGLYDRTPFFQMAGYQIALEELGRTDIEGRMIVRCGKDGSFEVKESVDFETDKRGFLACLELYRTLKTF